MIGRNVYEEKGNSRDGKLGRRDSKMKIDEILEWMDGIYDDQIEWSLTKTENHQLSNIDVIKI